MNSVNFLKQITDEYENVLSGVENDSEDIMKFGASVSIVDKIAFSDALEYENALSELELKDKEIDGLKTSLKNRINVLNSTTKKMPQFITTASNQRLIEIDENNFFFVTTAGAGSIAVYQSTDRCDSWKRVGGYYSLPSTDSKYSKNSLASLSITKDEVTFDDGSKSDAARIYWIDSNYRIKTSVINPLNGIYLDEEIVVDTIEKKEVGIGSLRALNNISGDEIVVYSETDGSYSNAKCKIKGAGKSIWIGIPFLTRTGNNNDVIHDIIVVDNVFYIAVSNSINRFYLVKIEKNAQGDFEKEIIEISGTAYKNVKLFEVGKEIWITSSENVLTVEPQKEFVFVFTNLGIASSTTSPLFTILPDGRYLKLNTKDIYKNEKHLFSLVEHFRVDKVATMSNETKTLIPFIPLTSEDGWEIKLFDMKDLVQNPTVKGI